MSGRSSKPLRLFSLPPAWGLPTWHPDCLKVQAYLRLAGVRFDNDQSTSAAMASYDTPVLVAGEETVLAGSDEIIQYLKTEGYDLDAPLGQQDKAEVFAFCAMVEGPLLSVMHYDWWMVDDNYYEVIRPIYTAGSSFPANILLPWSISRRMRARLGHPSSEEGEHMYKQAGLCYSALSARLGSQAFFFGDSPSSLDAIVFAHLATHLYAPMPSPARLSTMVQEHPNLCAFVERVNSKYMNVSLGIFSRRAPEAATKGSESPRKDGTSSKEEKAKRSPKDKARRRRAIDFCAAGVLLTVGFVLVSNWITVEAGDVGGD